MFCLHYGGEGEQQQHSLGGAFAVLLVLSGGVLPVFVRCKFRTLHGMVGGRERRRYSSN